jgi:hypothetical protein
VNDAPLRETLYGRRIFTVSPPHDRTARGYATPWGHPGAAHRYGVAWQTHPRQAQLACAAGYSCPVVESILASLLSREARQLRYQVVPEKVRLPLMEVEVLQNGARVS